MPPPDSVGQQEAQKQRPYRLCGLLKNNISALAQKQQGGHKQIRRTLFTLTVSVWQRYPKESSSRCLASAVPWTRLALC